MAAKRKPTTKKQASAPSAKFSVEHYRELGGEETAVRERGFVERGSSPRGPELGEDEASPTGPAGPRGRTVK